MPELPEVETVVRGLQSTVVSRPITAVQVFRDTNIRPLSSDAFIEPLEGRIIRSVIRRAKYILFELEPELLLVGHLRMTGKFIATLPLKQPHKHHRVWFHLGEDLLMVFQDSRCLGTLELYESLEAFEAVKPLGVEPLSENLTSDYLEKSFGSRSAPIKNLLMDQTRVAGIGNIYASEILFATGIAPTRPGNKLKTQDYKNLVQVTQQILNEAIKKNGTSISDFRRVDEQTGEFQNFLKVYGKTDKPCPRCSGDIKRIVQQQRSSFYCPSCQR